MDVDVESANSQFQAMTLDSPNQQDNPNESIRMDIDNHSTESSEFISPLLQSQGQRTCTSLQSARLSRSIIHERAVSTSSSVDSNWMNTNHRRNEDEESDAESSVSSSFSMIKDQGGLYHPDLAEADCLPYELQTVPEESAESSSFTATMNPSSFIPIAASQQVTPSPPPAISDLAASRRVDTDNDEPFISGLGGCSPRRVEAVNAILTSTEKGFGQMHPRRHIRSLAATSSRGARPNAMASQSITRTKSASRSLFQQIHKIVQDRIKDIRIAHPTLTRSEFVTGSRWKSQHRELTELYTDFLAGRNHSNPTRGGQWHVCNQLQKAWEKPPAAAALPHDANGLNDEQLNENDEQMMDIPISYDSDSDAALFSSRSAFAMNAPLGSTSTVVNNSTAPRPLSYLDVRRHDCAQDLTDSAASNATLPKTSLSPSNKTIDTVLPPPTTPSNMQMLDFFEHSYISKLPPRMTPFITKNTDPPTVYNTQEHHLHDYPTLHPNAPPKLREDWEYSASRRRNRKLTCAGCDDYFNPVRIERYCWICKLHFCRRHWRRASQTCHMCHIKDVQKSRPDRKINRDDLVYCLADYTQEHLAVFADYTGEEYVLSTLDKDISTWIWPEVLAHRKLPDKLSWYTLVEVKQTLKFTFEGQEMQVGITRHRVRGSGEWLNCVKVHAQELLDWSAYDRTTGEWFDKAWPEWKRNHAELKRLQKEFKKKKVRKYSPEWFRHREEIEELKTRWYRKWSYPDMFNDIKKSGCYASVQRLSVNMEITWDTKLGPKKGVFASPLKMAGPDGWFWEVNYRKHLRNTQLLLHVAAALGFILDVEVDTFYSSLGLKDHYDRLLNNFLGYMHGAKMLPHQDVCKPNAFDDRLPATGFDMKLIMIGTLRATPREEVKHKQKFGNKELNFLSRGLSVVSQRMSVLTIPGDVLMMAPPATTEWYHNVPAVDCDEAISMQWRRNLGPLESYNQAWFQNLMNGDVVRTWREDQIQE